MQQQLAQIAPCLRVLRMRLGRGFQLAPQIGDRMTRAPPRLGRREGRQLTRRRQPGERPTVGRRQSHEHAPGGIERRELDGHAVPAGAQLHRRRVLVDPHRPIDVALQRQRPVDPHLDRAGRADAHRRFGRSRHMHHRRQIGGDVGVGPQDGVERHHALLHHRRQRPPLHRALLAVHLARRIDGAGERLLRRIHRGVPGCALRCRTDRRSKTWSEGPAAPASRRRPSA